MYDAPRLLHELIKDDVCSILRRPLNKIVHLELSNHDAQTDDDKPSITFADEKNIKICPLMIRFWGVWD